MTEVLLFLLLLIPVSAIFGHIYFKVYINKHQKELEDKSRFISPYALVEIKDRATALADSVEDAEKIKQDAWDVIKRKIDKGITDNVQKICLLYDDYKNIPPREFKETLEYLGYSLETMFKETGLHTIKHHYDREWTLYIRLR